MFHLNKRKLFLFILILFAFPLGVTQSINARTLDDNRAKETDSGNKYQVGETVEIKDSIDGDLYVMGQKVTVSGDVEDNANVAGGEILIEGDVNGDLSIAGGYVVINGDVGDDLRVVGGMVYINSENIGGDLTVKGGEVYISSATEFNGEDLVEGGKIYKNSTNNPTDLSESKYNRFDLNIDASRFVKGLTVFGFTVLIISLISTLIAGVFIVKMFPVFTDSTLKTMEKQPAKSTGYGCLTMIVAPILAFILLFTLVGYKLMFLLLLLGIVAFIFAEIYSKLLVGRFIMRKLGQKNNTVIDLLIGIIVVNVGFLIIGFVPILGALVVGLASLFMAAWGVGAIIVNKFSKI